MTGDPDVVYVATDLPEMLEQEKAIAGAILVRLNIQRPNLHFSVAGMLLIVIKCCKPQHLFSPTSPL